MGPSGAMPLWMPNMTITGQRPPMSTAGTHAAFSARKVKKMESHSPTT